MSMHSFVFKGQSIDKDFAELMVENAKELIRKDLRLEIENLQVIAEHCKDEVAVRRLNRCIQRIEDYLA